MSNDFFQIDEPITLLAQQAMEKSHAVRERIDVITEYNQQKVLSAFIQNRVSETHFVPSTGYGYGDRGRDVLDQVFADTFGAEDALVRHSFVCGTQTLSVALFGVLRPGDTMLCITGQPYDTIHPVIGIVGEGQGSLKDFGIGYRQIDLLPSGEIDEDAVLRATEDPAVKMVYLQRSRGYALRDSLSVAAIGNIAKKVKEKNKDIIVMVDNCYGEFVEKLEPTQVGADLMAGSLIKNPGGGIAKTGGYIAGRKDLIELCSYRMTTAGIGREVGASLGENREMFLGFFHAPHVTGEALKTAVFTAALFALMGFSVSPKVEDSRHDIIQLIELGSDRLLTSFCRGLQSGAPIDSFVIPEASDMPGYESQVIMSAGAFTLGSSIELSADAPLREPFAVWLQGGLNFHSAKAAVLLAAQAVYRAQQESNF